MARYTYVEQMLIGNGFARHCSELPVRDAGHSAHRWMLDVRDVASTGIHRKTWDLAFAQDLIYCAELICVELNRFPDIIGWDWELYSKAAESSIHPLDKDRLRPVTDPDFFDDNGPLDAETIAFLDGLTKDDGDEARS
jgi:hypothetical protein